MKKAFIINGYARCGKDTFVNFVTQHLHMYNIKCFNISSVDEVKHAAATLGWDGIKDNKGRTFLSNLKDLSTSFYDGPFNFMLHKYEYGEDGIYFFHVREPDEIDRLCVALNDCDTILIIKDDNPKEFDNHADMESYKYIYTYEIHNNGDLEKFKWKAIDWCSAANLIQTFYK